MIWVTLVISYKWSCAGFVLLCLDHFPHHDALEVHLDCGMSQDFFLKTKEYSIVCVHTVFSSFVHPSVDIWATSTSSTSSTSIMNDAAVNTDVHVCL